MTENTFHNSVASPLLSALFLEKDRLLITGSTDGQVSDWNAQHLKAKIHGPKTETIVCFLGVVLFSQWWLQVPSGDKNGPSEDGEKT